MQRVCSAQLQLLLLVLMSCNAALVASYRQQLQQASSLSASQEALLAAWRNNTFSFWSRHGPDPQFGGFHGTLDRYGGPIEPTTKSLVQQARHLWAFSLLQERGGLETAAAEGLPSSKDIADGQYDFVMGMRDPSDGRYWYEVSRDGYTVTTPGKNLYANMFVIYGLSKYAQVFKRLDVVQQALDCFRAWDAEAHDAITGGYDESSSSPVLDSVPLGNQTRQVGQVKVPQLSRSFNTHLHSIEALAELLRAAPQEPTVSARLKELTDILINKMVVNGSYIAANYDLNWQPLPSNISYGHNIEAAWLVADAIDTLSSARTINGSTAAQWKTKLVAVGSYAAAAGYDTQYGGVYESGPPGQSASSTNKTWWAQAEAMLGFAWLHQQTGQQTYLDMLASTMQFVEAHLHDKEYGEWYWQSNRAGDQLLGFNSGGIDFSPTTKGTAWKASYHTGRAALLLQQR